MFLPDTNLVCELRESGNGADARAVAWVTLVVGGSLRAFAVTERSLETTARDAAWRSVPPS